MKKFTLFSLCLLLLSTSQLLAQTDWRLGGNTLSTSSSIGSNNNYSLIFKTNNAERARLTGAGLLGIGTNTPTAKLHVNSAAGQSPFRVQINGGTRLLVNSNGGLAVGASSTAPDNGLYVNGSVKIGTINPSDYYKLEVIASTSDGGIRGEGRSVGVYGYSYNEDASSIGVQGRGLTVGVQGLSTSRTGVSGYSTGGDGGSFYSDFGIGLRAATQDGAYAAIFEGDTFTSGTAYQGSDQNIKKNIEGMSNALSIINKLKPKHYEFRNDGKYASLHLPKGNHYGLLAQDVEEVLPELVKESVHPVVDVKATAASQSSADGNSAPLQPVLRDSKETMTIKGVNYTEMIPLLIAAVQEQQQTIEQLKKENNIFKEQFAKLELGTGSIIKLTPADLMGVSLEQNSPNPTGSKTTFRYTVPANANAQILVYNSASGKLVKTLQAPASGQVELNTADLEAGTYIYTLVVDGKQTTAKQLMLSK